MPDLKEAARRQGSFGGTLKAVAASFFGVRAGRAHEQDVSRLNPVHVIVAGLLLAIVFVLTLVAIVRYVAG
jgi:hypothetical protein